jgi:hypothetical protein
MNLAAFTIEDVHDFIVLLVILRLAAVWKKEKKEEDTTNNNSASDVVLLLQIETINTTSMNPFFRIIDLNLELHNGLDVDGSP